MPWWNTSLIKDVQGLYVNGSSGECIYQSVEDRKLILEEVMAVAKGKLTIIAHVACNNTKDSMELARHAESLGVDAIATIPPIYFRLPEYSVAKYWNDISSAAPNTDYVIYNIPQFGRGCFDAKPLHRNVEESTCYRCEELFYASSRYPNFCEPWWRRPTSSLTVQMSSS